MAHVYGTVLACIFLPIIFLGSVLIYMKRENLFIKMRHPPYVLVQNAGTFLSFLLLSQYISQPIGKWSCEINYIGLILLYSVIMVALIVRCWRHCIRYHIAQMRVQFRSSLFHIESVNTSWLYRNRWVVERKFLDQVLVFFIFLFNLPIFIPYAVQGPFVYDEETKSCTFGQGWRFASPFLAIFILCVSIILGRLIYHSRDAFHCKREIIILAITWAIILVVVFCFNIAGATRPGSELALTLTMVGEIITFLTTNGLSLLYTLYYERADKMKVGTMDEFSSQLESASFRNCFHDFLTKQFCQENLQFFEMVTAWKALPPTDPSKRVTANVILDNFVKESSICQVNIDCKLRDAAIAGVNKDPIPNDTFDGVVEVLVGDMYVNSYRLFSTANPRQSIFD